MGRDINKEIWRAPKKRNKMPSPVTGSSEATSRKILAKLLKVNKK